MSGDGDVSKHLGVEDRRRRFDWGSKYGGRGGYTLIKGAPKADARGVKGVSDVFLKVSRPKDEDGNVLVSELDLQMPDILGPFGDLEKGREGGRLFELPELLEAACISKKTERDRHVSDVVITTYVVAGVAWASPSGEEKQLLEQQREARLTLARPIQSGDEDPTKWRVFCKFRDAPLESITEPLLVDQRTKLSASGHDGCNPKRAMIFSEDHQACWCAPVKEFSSHYLQVDLGADCRVTCVSTQGRFPPLLRADKALAGVRLVSESSIFFQNWVTRYELSYRTNSGREWIVAGDNILGNEDMMTEVVHRLAREGRDLEGAVCRYLRFRPLAYHKLPAMRVGVYGHRLSERAEKLEKAAMEENVVKYSIHKVKLGVNLRRTPGGQLAAHCCTRKWCRCHDLPEVAVRRKRLRQNTVEEVRLLGQEQELGEALWLDTFAESDPEITEGTGAFDDAEGMPQPTLSRIRSFSETDLSAVNSAPSVDELSSVPLSSSQSDHFMVLSRAASAAMPSEDDWVVT